MALLRRSGAVLVALTVLAACGTPRGFQGENYGSSTPPSLAAPLPSGSAAASTATALSAVTAADRNFIAQAAYGGWGEVALGQLAQRKATSAGVREFGATMVRDHTQANQELAQIAARRGIVPPTVADPGRQATAAGLEALSGSEFDTQYIHQQVAEHNVAIALFRSEAEMSQDPDLRSFAARTLPTIQGHADMLRSMLPRAMSSR